MATVEKMNISLPREMRVFIKDVITSGEYATASEVLRDAMRSLIYERRAREAALQELRDEVRKGFESGPGEQLDVETFLTRARARWTAADRAAKR